MKYEKGSFIVVPNKLLLEGIDSYAQIVFFWLCDFADDAGTCWPSRTTLAKKSAISLASVDRALVKLEELGLVKKTKRYYEQAPTTNLYQLMIVQGGSLPQELPSPQQTVGVASHRRTELNPVLTQPIYITAEADFRREKPQKDYDTGATSRLCKRSEELLGRRWPNKGKQLKAISSILAAKYSEDQAWECFESLSEHQFWGENGYDWSTVLSEIGKAKVKKKINFKKY